MVTFARIFALINCAVLAAHFFRSGLRELAIASVATAVLVFFNRSWMRVVLQVVLLLGVFEWIRTMIELVTIRRAMGMPYVRLEVIMGSVAMLCGISAALLSLPRVVGRYQSETREASPVANALGPRSDVPDEVDASSASLPQGRSVL